MAKKKKKTNALKVVRDRGCTARAAISDLATAKARQEFLDRFIVCEVVCKAIIEYYLKEKPGKKSNGYITLNMRAISPAMSHFSLTIPNHVLNGIFGGSGDYKKRGTKSAKKLRDGIMHAASKEDIQEVVDRNSDLHKLMDEFLSYFLPEEIQLEPAMAAMAVI